MKNGWIEETNDIYQNGEGISRSSLSKILITPEHYKLRASDMDPELARERTLIHTAILEPELLKTNVIEPPKGSRVTKPVKIAWEAFWEELDDKGFLKIPLEEAKALKAKEHSLAYADHVVCVTDKDKILLEGIKRSIGNYPFYQSLLEGGVREQSGYFGLEWEGEKLLGKIRPDYRNSEKKYILDLKTTSFIPGFNQQFFNHEYHIQNAWYMDGAAIIEDQCYEKMYFLVVDVNKPTYSIKLWSSECDSLEHQIGREQYEDALDILVECMKENKWPGYPEKELKFKVPDYLIPRHMIKKEFE